MKTTLTVHGDTNTTIDVGYDDLAGIVAGLPDSDTLTETFAALAQHPSANVRESVASKDNLDEATVQLLTADPEVSVIRNIVRSTKAREVLTTETLIALIAKDVDVADSIAREVESFEAADVDQVAAALAEHSDPRVRDALAGNFMTPKKFVKLLLKDPDPRVQTTARQTLD